MRRKPEFKYIVGPARYAYRGYTITESRGANEWYVTRDGINIATAPTEDEARRTVEMLTEPSPPQTTCMETLGGDPDTAIRLSFQIRVF